MEVLISGLRFISVCSVLRKTRLILIQKKNFLDDPFWRNTKGTSRLTYFLLFAYSVISITFVLNKYIHLFTIKHKVRSTLGIFKQSAFPLQCNRKVRVPKLVLDFLGGDIEKEAAVAVRA